MYTLLQKKCTLISSTSPGDPGSLTPTPDHVKFVKMTRGRGRWPRDFRKLGWLSCALYSEKSVFTVCTRMLEETLKPGYSLNILTRLMSKWHMVFPGPNSWCAMSEWWLLACSAEKFAFLWAEGNIPKVPNSTHFIAYLQNYTHFVWKMTILTPFLCPHISTQFLN